MPDSDKKASYQMMKNQFGKNIGSIVIGLECGENAQQVLEAPGMDGSNPSCSGDGHGVELGDRGSWQYHVVRMNEEGKNAILIAARTSLFTELQLVEEKNSMKKNTSSRGYLSAGRSSENQLAILETQLPLLVFMGIARR